MENTPSAANTSSHPPDERTMAALAHASALLNFVVGFGGLIGAGAIWLTQKEKSAWVAFHGLQSLAFQIAQLALFLMIVVGPWVCGFLFSFITFGLGTFVAVPVMILALFVGLAILFAGLIYSLYGAYQVYEGREFRYYWIADWIEKQQIR